jgi:hypothetical protein
MKKNQRKKKIDMLNDFSGLGKNEFTRKEAIEYLKKSGIAQNIIDSQKNDRDKFDAEQWWNTIDLSEKVRPFEEARKSKKESGSEKEFLAWCVGKEEKIKNHLQNKGGKKIIVAWVTETHQISQSAIYDYLNIHFPPNK